MALRSGEACGGNGELGVAFADARASEGEEMSEREWAHHGGVVVLPDQTGAAHAGVRSPDGELGQMPIDHHRLNLNRLKMFQFD